MDSKAPASSLCLFKETRIDVEPTVPNSVIQIKVPSTGAFSIHSRQQRRMLRTLTTYKDADSFSKHGLANSASLYFDRSIQYPRSFLWRVVNDQEILELRAVDLSKSDKETREAKFILQFQFPTPLKHGGVALAGTEDGNALSVFALTKGNELYTFSLLKDFFCYAAASEEDISRWCKVSKLATFSISIPHRLIAGSSLQLVVSLSDGRILQLTRERGTDGSRWHEVTYGDGQWSSSLRGLIRWQGSNTVRYDGTALEQSTPIAMAISPDSNHIFAVCLNHTLRIWNPKKAASVFTKDLLCQNREPHQIPKVMLNPGSPNVLQIFQTNSAIEGDAYYVVTFSPHDVGEFKIWGIRDPDHGDQGVRDLFPEHSFKPPDPDPIPESKAIWKVADFKVKGEQRGEGLEMWILMRSNKCYKLYNTKFDIRDAATLWQDQWSVMASETMHDHPEPQVSNLDPEDVTERWLDYILLPGKYPETVLETALAIYSSERSAGLAKGKFSLKERMYTAIASQVNLSDVGQDFDKHRTRTHQEWIILWQHIHDLDQSRWEVLSLTLDEHTQMPWIAFADGCSAIRSSSKIEQISQNRHEDLAKSMNLLEMPSVETEDGDEPKLPDELAVIIEAASSFRQGFSRRLKQRCKTILAAELWLDPSFSVPLRIQSFYDQCHFADEIGNAPFDDLVIALGPIGGFDNLETGFFSAILDRFAHTMPEASAGLLFTSYGRKLLISGAREMIDLGERILLDLLVLVVFTEMEIDREETPMENFNAARIYIHLLEFLRKYQMMQWLVKSIPAPKDENTKNLIRSQGSGKDKVEQELHSTVLEILYIIDVKPRSHKTQSQSEALTGSIQDLLEWTVAGPMDRVPVYVQCSLLATHDTELASEFVRFLPSTAWAVYVKGRMVLINGNHTEAAIYFKKAAFKLSRPDSEMDYHGMSNSFLSPIEAAYFGQGLPTYYTHVLNLFDAASSPTYVAHFAHLALQMIPTARTPNTQQTALLTSLFHASLSTTDFPTAYSALTRHPSPKALLPIFIQTLLSTPGARPQLLSLPFPQNLHAEIDVILAQSKQPKILSAWRLHHSDFRGAAAALLPSLQQAQANPKRKGDGLEKDYLTTINLLACAGEENRWVLSGGEEEGKLTGVTTKRKIVTIDDLRAQYQKELDWKSVIEAGRYGFSGGNTQMDVS